MTTESLLAGGAALIALFVDALYLLVIASEDPSARDADRIALVAATVAVAGLACLGSLAAGPLRVPLLTGAATVLAVWGVVGIFSIGLPLLVATGLAGAAAYRAAETAPSGAFRAAIALPIGVLAFLVAGIALTG